MEYKVVVTADAEEDLNQYIRYLLIVKKNDQAAKNVLDDFEAIIWSLKTVAGSLKLCDNPRLKELQYRRINFLSHRYFMLYRIIEDIVFIDSIFHELQDYENKMI
ncbi:MAG: type II toxin-antitoxin system RelE/ParE family toxin [Dorea sp.]|jgi:toxin ParE1/3/4|nr:type II toxin-antitoxin system RelE/ParE family toxin [Dorea sp.]